MVILVAEDESDVRELIRVNLEENGYSVISAKNGLEAWESIKNREVHLAILDVMMPVLDGFNLLRKIREVTKIPVIFLTARDNEMDKVLGLGIGADDYMVKPFSMSELLARVSAQLRRSHMYFTDTHENASKIECGDLVLDKASCCVYKNSKEVELNAKEYHLLKYLMENPKQVFTKKQLYRAVWDEEAYYDENTIMVHISHIRSKIEADSKNPEYLKTVRGIGYRFDSSLKEH